MSEHGDLPRRRVGDSSEPVTDVLGELECYIRHNAVLPSDHEGSGRVVPLSMLRGWIQRERQRGPRERPLITASLVEAFRTAMRSHFSNLPSNYAKGAAWAEFENHISLIAPGHCECWGSRDCPHG